MKSNVQSIKKQNHEMSVSEKDGHACEELYPEDIMEQAAHKKPQDFMPFKEFVALMVLLMSLSALSIDAVLPMLGILSEEMNIVNANHTQYVISVMFLGLTLGKFFYGPLSDSYGRKSVIYVGIGLFCIGSVIGLIADNFPLFLFGRALQGLGAVAAQVVTMAMVRDLYSGREMARIMSIIMGVFIIVYAIAPSIGQLILILGHWRHIFVVLLLVAITGVTWMHLRLRETLSHEKRRPLNFKTLWQGIREAILHRITCVYTICIGLVFAGDIGYITSSQQIFHEYYDTGKLFPVYFSFLALAFGAASMINSCIIQQYGMQLITRYAFIGMIVTSSIFIVMCMIQPVVSFLLFMVYTVIIFFCIGMLLGNLRAIAMEPMGHIAGTASSVIGTVSSVISLVIGSLIGLSYNGSLFPLIIGFLATASAGLMLQLWLERSK